MKAAVTKKKPEREKESLPFEPANPFRGIVPFEESDTDRFFGRQREIEMVVRALAQARMVVLTGQSGCGKTSLLKAGVIPRLRRSRVGGDRAKTALPLIFRSWATLRREAGHDVNSTFCRLLDKENSGPMDDLIELARNKDKDVAWLWEKPAALSALEADNKAFKAIMKSGSSGKLSPEELITKLAERCNGVVLVLDQFEEILRSTREIAEQTCNLVNRLLRNCQVVLSMRTEHLGDLDDLKLIEVGGGIRGDKIRRVQLDELSLDDSVSVLDQMGKRGGVAVDRNLIHAIRNFTSQRTKRRVSGEAHMFCYQAVVKEMWDALHRQGAELDRFDMDRFNSAFATSIGKDAKEEDLFAIAIKNTFDGCFGAASHNDADESALFRYIAARAAPRFSSAGFKTPQGQADLLDEIAREANVASGTLREKFGACLERLKDRNILKSYEVTFDKLWELRHDRIGDPLIEWAKSIRDTFDDCVASPGACSGVTPIKVPLRSAASKKTRNVSVAWNGCFVRPELGAAQDALAPLTSLKFKKCIFAGTIFDHIEFRNCEFDHCNLDGVLFKRCTFNNCKFVGGGREPGDRGYTLGFLGCKFEGANVFSDSSLAQLAFSAAGQTPTLVETDVRFENVKLQLAWFGGASLECSGKFLFTKQSMMRWCSWDKSFDPLIKIEENAKTGSGLDLES